MTNKIYIAMCRYKEKNNVKVDLRVEAMDFGMKLIFGVKIYYRICLNFYHFLSKINGLFSNPKRMVIRH